MATAVGIDVGGTKIAAGLVAPSGEVTGRVRCPTPDGEDQLVEALCELAGDVSDDADVPVGVGLAALVDLDGTARFGVNIGVTELPLAAVLRERLGRAVAVFNDADTAAWAEHRVGAGRERASTMVLFTVGTGVGGGIVLDGHLVRGAHGFANELGHMVVDEGGPRCPCGNRGCLEARASGTAIGRMAREAVASGDVAAGSPLATVAELEGEAVTEAAQAGDPDALRILAEAGFWLGVGAASITNALDPALIVVGGGVLAAGDLLLEPARRSCAERIEGAAHRPLPPVVPAALGGDAGLVGAGLLAIEHAA